MSVTATNDYSGPYSPDGATVTFPFTFRALAAADVVVLRVAADGTQTILSGYTVSLNTADGGSVAFGSAPLAGDPLYVVLDPSFEQQATFANQGAFSPKSINDALDRGAQRDIALKAAISRAVLAPPADTLGQLPPAAERAGMFMAFDAAGLAIPASGTGNDSALRTDLASNNGFTLIKYKSSKSGSYARSAAQLARIGGGGDANAMTFTDPSLDDAVLNGTNTTDLTPYLQNGFNSLGAAGGKLFVPNGARFLIDTSLTVQPNCHLVGPHAFVGSPQNNLSAPYGNVGGALIVNSAGTINLKGGASVNGLLIYRKGMTFPAADASAFVGTPITAGGDDASVTNCMVLGFDQAFYSINNQRVRIDRMQFDCNNGIHVEACFDIGYITRCHGWAFATVAALGTPLTYQRTGYAYRVMNGADWFKLTDNFSYGYYRGFSVTSCNNVTVQNCGSDNTPPFTYFHTGAAGLVIDGTSNETRVSGFQAAANSQGIVVNTSAGTFTEIDRFQGWNNIDDGLVVTGGDVRNRGGRIRGSQNGVIVNNAASTVESRYASMSGNTVNYVSTAGFLFGDFPLPYAALPPPGSAGRKAIVSDATATTYASIVAGGGSNKVPVWDNGTNWVIG